MNRLSTEEISFFKREGYLIKRGVLDPDLMARARERKWAGAPDRMKPDDPTTWIGPWRPEEETPESEENCRVGHYWQYRAPARKEWLVRMTVANPIIVGWVGQLLGEGMFEPEGVRGIYCMLPSSGTPDKPGVSQKLVCHCDVNPEKLHSTPFQRLLKAGVGAVGLIAPIPPNGGAFTVWPGTHKIIYDLMIRTEGLARNEAYKQRIIDFNSDRHVDGWGGAGDVLLWHRLLAHTAGANRSEKLQLREAVLFDYPQPEAEKPKASYTELWSRDTGEWPSQGHRLYNNTVFNCRDVGTRPYNQWPDHTPGYWSADGYGNIYRYTKINNLFLSRRPAAQLEDFANKNFSLETGAPAIDSGKPVTGITNGFFGEAPDLGAYESGGARWVPGGRGRGEHGAAAGVDEPPR